jgi:PleD family two-component response regulator
VIPPSSTIFWICPKSRLANKVETEARLNVTNRTGTRLFSIKQLTGDEGVTPMARILLVEDNEMIRDVLSERLERKGLHVYRAVVVAQGVEVAKSERLDLILMDMSLPNLKSIEPKTKIQNTETLKSWRLKQ